MSGSSGLPRVLFVVGHDPALEVRLRRLHAAPRRSGRGFELLVSREFDASRDAALFIVPAAAVNTLLGGGGRLALPVLAYGNEQGLAPAFLRGCVDYLREPWSLSELQLRVQLWLERRETVASPGVAHAAGGGIRLRGTTLHGAGGAVALSVAEARLLEMLLYNAGRVTSREALFYRLWGRLPARRSRAIDVHVAALRRKTRIACGAGAAGDGAGPTITAVRGEGYLLAVAAQPAATRTAKPAGC
ncbi:MAG: winged helix-turn-helix domain-containing protein [Spirochaetaceae bacterium]|nr:winged helix-turn-helix domain-containing protein [Spirochaetaceae bacterium]